MNKCAIFDMDGTLLDTLGFTVKVMNRALCSFGFPALPEAQIRGFLGASLTQMSERLLLAAAGNASGARNRALQLEIRRQIAVLLRSDPNAIRPYPEVPKILDGLRRRGFALGVVSNTPHDLTRLLIDRFFPGVFPVVLGERSDIPRKPNPDGVLLAAASLECADGILVGDSAVDLETGRNANLPVVMVDWGVLSREELQQLNVIDPVGDADTFFRIIGELSPR